MPITELQRRQPRIQRIAGYQLLVGANRYQFSLIHHCDPVSVYDRGQAVGDDQSGAVFHQAW